MIVRRTIALAALIGCGTIAGPAGPVDAGGISVVAAGADAEWVPIVTQDASLGRALVSAFFGRPVAGSFAVRLFPDGPSWEGYWRSLGAFGAGPVPCWVIGGASRGEVALLAPRTWNSLTCGHNGQDESYRRGVLAHEIVHLRHLRANPANLGVIVPLRWFFEGLAVFGGGQLGSGNRASVRNELAGGPIPSLAGIMNGSEAYSVAGVLVEYLDRRIGRAALAALLTATTSEEVLARIGLTERELLDGFRQSVLAP
ncbi:MAG: hypothetical protein HOP28_13765 [Gemmatimonadales bacterium]|nr:hypothetical protein [Gemmatimonadales bacterium]